MLLPTLRLTSDNPGSRLVLSIESVRDRLTMSSVRFYTNSKPRARADEDQGHRDDIRQSVEDYRRKIRFKQVKFSIIVLAWQSAILVLRWLYVVDCGDFKFSFHSMLLIEYNGQIASRSSRRPGPGAELEHMARITTFIIVFISIFCGWPCLLHFMAGFAKTGVVLSSVTGCLVFQSSIILRALICLAVTGTKLQFSLHDMTEAVLVTASFHIRN